MDERVKWRKSSRSSANGGNCVEVADFGSAAEWVKSSRSGANGGNCVEVAGLDRLIGVRDSKNPDGPRLTLSQQGWSVLLAEVRSGRHDL